MEKRYRMRLVSGIVQQMKFLSDKQGVEEILGSLPEDLAQTVRQQLRRGRNSFTACEWEPATKRAFMANIEGGCILTWTWWHGVPDEATAGRLWDAIEKMEASGELIYGVSRAERVLEQATGRKLKSKTKPPLGVVEI